MTNIYVAQFLCVMDWDQAGATYEDTWFRSTDLRTTISGSVFKEGERK